MPPPGGMPMANGPPSGGMMRPPGMPGPMGPAGAAPMPGYNPQQAAAGMQQMSLGGPPGPPVGANRQADIARGWRAAQQLQLCRQLGIAVSVCSNRCAACNCWQWSHENSAGTSIRRYMVESSAITLCLLQARCSNGCCRPTFTAHSNSSGRSSMCRSVLQQPEQRLLLCCSAMSNCAGRAWWPATPSSWASRGP